MRSARASLRVCVAYWQPGSIGSGSAQRTVLAPDLLLRPVADGPLYDSLDIRIGRVNKVRHSSLHGARCVTATRAHACCSRPARRQAWKHPEAEKLFVEEVDVGEAEPRQVRAAPGAPRALSTHADCTSPALTPRRCAARSAPAWLATCRRRSCRCAAVRARRVERCANARAAQGRLVVVLCNLKARNMRGVKSFGMLLAASDAAHENVELVRLGCGAPRATSHVAHRCSRTPLYAAVAAGGGEGGRARALRRRAADRP